MVASSKNVEDWEKIKVAHDFFGSWWNALKELRGITLNQEQTERLILGVADKVRKERLEKEFPGINIDEDFLKDVNARIIAAAKVETQLMPGALEFLQDQNFEQCIVTGATFEQLATKMDVVPEAKSVIEPKKWFSADMVENSKPAPDLFLLAAEKMNCPTEKLVCIGDTVNDCIAAKAAGAKFFAFLGATGSDTPEKREKFLQLGVKPDEFAVSWPELHQKVLAWANLKK